MHRLETVVVPIRRGFAEVYALLSEPRNYPRWSPVPDPHFEPVDGSGLRWLVDLPRGQRVLRFSPKNDFGVLDYSVHLKDGSLEHTAYLRLIPNDDGCTLITHYLMHAGVTEEQFDSEVTWLENDLRAVAATLEAG